VGPGAGVGFASRLDKLGRFSIFPPLDPSEVPVANHPSAEKRNRQRIKRTLRNRAIKSVVRTHVKTVQAAIAAKDQKAAKEALLSATVAIDKAASKGALPKEAASRKVSRLSAQVHKLSAA
jgi:small subunit ribosomal protein S20